MLMKEFSLSKEDLLSILDFCFGGINGYSGDNMKITDNIMNFCETPMREIKAAIKRTIPKLNQLEKLKQMRRQVTDEELLFLDNSYVEKDDTGVYRQVLEGDKGFYIKGDDDE